ncbi:MAG: iron transporter [Clostridium sp.]|nr:iron transporter [Clostridium sp.]
MSTFIKNKYMYIVAMLLVLCMSVTACKSTDSNDRNNDTETVTEENTERTQDTEEPAKIDLPDGMYTAEFTTDSSMFHVNEAYDNKGILTVKDGQATIHITLTSKKIVNLFLGTAEDARKDGAELLEPTTDTVDYEDGTTDEAYGFDVPVPALDEEFDLALIGTKGEWYDHKVKVSNPQPQEDTADTIGDVQLSDGTYEIDLDFEGGSGKASISSPARVTISNGDAIATVEWSSPNYDYMLIDGEKYMPVNTEGNSVFEIPVILDEPMQVIGDTVAMSTPHEIEYTLTFHSQTAQEVSAADGE